MGLTLGDMQHAARQAATAARGEQRAQDIRDACGWCAAGREPHRHDDGHWRHGLPGVAELAFRCRASAIRERAWREQGRDGDAT